MQTLASHETVDQLTMTSNNNVDMACAREKGHVLGRKGMW